MTWPEGFGDEGGLWDLGAYNDRERDRTEYDKVQRQDDEATPVELVSVLPPLVGHYSVGSDDKDPTSRSRSQIHSRSHIRDCRGLYVGAINDATAI